jgi:hypothetical protein
MTRPQTGLRMMFLTVALLGAILGWSRAICNSFQEAQQRFAARRVSLETDLREWEKLKRNSRWLGADASVEDFFIAKISAEINATK